MAVQKVAIVIHEGVQALDVAGPVDVLAEANNYVPAEDRYETVLIAADRRPLRASNRMQMIADVSFEDASGDFGILLVAGGPHLPDAGPDRLAALGSGTCGGLRFHLHGSLRARRCRAARWAHGDHPLAERTGPRCALSRRQGGAGPHLCS